MILTFCFRAFFCSSSKHASGIIRDRYGYKIGVSGIPDNATLNDIRNFFKGLTINNIRNIKNGFSTVHFNSEADAIAAFDYHLRFMGDKYITICKWDDRENSKEENYSSLKSKSDFLRGIRKNVVFLTGMPLDFSDQDIATFFQDAGKIDYIKWGRHADGSKQGYVHVTFINQDSVQRALKLNGSKVSGRTVVVALPRSRVY